MRSKIIFLVLLIVLLLQPLLIIFQNQSKFFGRGYASRFESLQEKYYNSQYATKNYKEIITDEFLESFAGGKFLQGISPILIHHDQPPLGRYIIALSIALFDNEKTIPLILLMISALGIYLVGLQVLKNKFLALIPFGIFVNQLMFLNKFNFIPLLEPIQFTYIIFAIYAFIVGVQKKIYIPFFIIVALLIGAVISIRYFVLGAALASSFVLYLILNKKIIQTVVLSMSFFLSFLMLIGSYYQTFLSGYSLVKVIGIQKYIFVYHRSAFVMPFSFWDLLFFNRWHTWWGNNAILSDAEWSILWPISVVIILQFVIYSFWKKILLSPAEQILIIWISVYAIMLSVGYTSTRYFLPLVPFLYILSIDFIIRIIKFPFKKSRTHKKISKNNPKTIKYSR